jgi:DNA-binding transcriptional ArsR family regulator
MPPTYFTQQTAALDQPESILPVNDARVVARFFQALADPTRVRILKALAEGEWCVTDLTLALGMDQPAVSHQLAYLREQGLVAHKKHGRHVYYALSDAHLREILFSSLAHLDTASV